MPTSANNEENHRVDDVRSGSTAVTHPAAPPRVQQFARWMAAWFERAAGELAHRNPTALTILALCIATVVGIGFAQVGGEIYEWALGGGNASRAVDAPVLNFMMEQRTPGLNSAVTGFTDLGGPKIFPVVAVLILGWLTWQSRSVHRLVVVVAGTASALVMIGFGKELTQRSRPDHAFAVPPFESSPSFPSGHTMNSTVFAVLVAYVAWNLLTSRWARTLLVTLCSLWALGMGLSRVYLGHHWLTDVLAGWTFGLAWAIFVVVLDQAWILLRRRRRARIA